MDYEIIFSPRSLEDLDEVLDPIREDDEDAANAFERGLIAHIKQLNRFPRMGERVIRRGRVRKLTHSPAIVYYRIWEARREVEIIHIRHGARKPPSRTDLH